MVHIAPGAEIMTDKYRAFAELRLSEREGIDYRVRFADRPSRIAIIAPHGGKIEPATSEIAVAIAGDDHSFYCFEGIKPDHNGDLHITSINFDEPVCVGLVSRAGGIVAVHGSVGDNEEARVGGLHHVLRGEICAALRVAGFDAAVETSGPYAGKSPENICNRGSLRAGVQLEITRGLRDKLLGADDDIGAFARAVRSAIALVFKHGAYA
jgi:phage replication-related protein YjqB (UPF0714/DUF867 family)